MKKFSMILLVFIIGCKSVQTNSDNSPLIYMKKTPCMGTCPNYDISVFENGKVLLNAREYVELEGEFYAKMSKSKVQEFIALFEQAEFESLKNEYTSNRTDLPTTTLSFNFEGKEKTVVDYDGAPEKLKVLEAQVHALIEDLNWKPVK